MEVILSFGGPSFYIHALALTHTIFYGPQLTVKSYKSFTLLKNTFVESAAHTKSEIAQFFTSKGFQLTDEILFP